jgi:hypothetical protein
MQRVRDVLRQSLRRTLSSLSDEDRLVAAWPVACGPALAARAEVLGLEAEGVLRVRVLQPEWREQFVQMRTMLADDVSRIAGVRVQTIHFEGQGANRRVREVTAPVAAKGTRRTSAAERKILEKH